MFHKTIETMNRIIQFLKQDVLLICLFSLIYVEAMSQDKNTTSSDALTILSEYSGDLYGTNDFVVNGRSYIPDHYNAKGDPYLFSDKWVESTIVIEGKKYGNQEILYNIDTEKLILKSSQKINEEVLLVLNTEFVDAFYFGEHYFVNGYKNFPDRIFPGFVEQVYSGNFVIVIRYQKSFISNYTANAPNGFYSGTKSAIYISEEGTLKKLPTKKALLDYFLDQKKEIKKFIRKNNIKYKKANAIQLNKLFSYCDTISSK